MKFKIYVVDDDRHYARMLSFRLEKNVDHDVHVFSRGEEMLEQLSGEPDMILQLSVSQDGIIAGSYFNSTTETTLPVEGMVDKDTQRAAWTVVNEQNNNPVMETGVYNLTQDEASVLVHFGTDTTQEWLLVRLEEPEGTDAPAE